MRLWPIRFTSAEPEEAPAGTFGWSEQRDRLIWTTPPTPVAHQAWAVTQWAPGAAGDHLQLTMHPLRPGTWPLVQWIWRVQASPLLLNSTLERKIKRLELAVGERDTELGPRRDEWTALAGLRAMRDAIVFHGESLVESDAIVTVTSTPELLEDDVLLLLARWESLGWSLRPLTYEQEWAVLRAWGAGPLPATQGRDWRERWHQLFHRPPAAATTWEPRVTTAQRLADCIWPGWGMAGDGPEQGVYVGHTDQAQPIFVNFFQDEGGVAANLLAVGATGMGKSFWMKTVIRGLLAQGFFVTIFDVDGEYRSLCTAEGGTWIDVSGTQVSTLPDAFAIPLAVGMPAEDRLRWDRMLQTASQMLQILGELNLVMTAAVQQAIITAWARYGVTPDDPASWDTPIIAPHPTMMEVWTELQAMDTPEAQEAAKRLWVYVHGSQRRLFAGTVQAWPTMPTPLVVWHLGNLAMQGGMMGQSLPPETAGRYLLVLSTTWEWLRSRRQQHAWTAVMVDEGQRILNQDILGRAVVDLASTIRKWNGILGFATNNPAPLWQTPYGQGIWATMPIKAFLRLEKNQATEAAQALKMPGAVTRALSDIPERQVIMRLWHDHWTSVRALVPPDEETLYQTRGLRPTH